MVDNGGATLLKLSLIMNEPFLVKVTAFRT